MQIVAELGLGGRELRGFSRPVHTSSTIRSTTCTSLSRHAPCSTARSVLRRWPAQARTMMCKSSRSCAARERGTHCASPGHDVRFRRRSATGARPSCRRNHRAKWVNTTSIAVLQRGTTRNADMNLIEMAIMISLHAPGAGDDASRLGWLAMTFDRARWRHGKRRPDSLSNEPHACHQGRNDAT